MKKVLLYVGVVRLKANGDMRWPIHIAPFWIWKAFLKHPVNMTKLHGAFYVFRNLPGVIKWEKGRLLPRRWGFGILGLVEFGDRG